ncbi:uncharacterized protein HaLaN_22227 [Haematococcus lacustris]|uniref:Uncharacterized protein n=1 Tax=Haematococcus lacustris TaxID=44745 RepID=A0A699ZQ74_HAELA|nr:uncharacterized protein HaLaN_22227 [Haematococcus lacustris]
MEAQAGVASSQAYKDLEKQIDQRVAANKVLAPHRRQDTLATDTRLKELLTDYYSQAELRLRAAHTRQAALVATDALVGALDHGGLLPLAQLGDPQPEDFPRPPRGSERWERAMQAHALALADARAGPAWWSHLRALNRGQAQQALLQEDEEHWQAG